MLDKSDGVVERDEQFMRRNREATIKEYFFGDSKRTLSPLTQSISFDDVAIFKAPDGMLSHQPETNPITELTPHKSWTHMRGSLSLKLQKYRQKCRTGRSLS